MILSQGDLVELVKQGGVTREDGLDVSIDLVSIGLHLGTTFLRYKDVAGARSLPFEAPVEAVELNSNGEIDFRPGAGILATTAEVVDIPLNRMGFIQTKGTIARGFVTVHLCDGQIDPGYRGRITLELVNFSKFHYTLRPGIPIAQLFIHHLTGSLQVGYSGRYQFAEFPTSMRCKY
ncbi:dCTP deaminase [Luteolibacter luteus]|uniref:dCTP deaminase n=1 Tax=Luteolibacter luteus TaxID=2728835 RepID=A0A858RII9_9BACT|nr:hypothetical protein [Luteolibacter luteus]QJE96239.1 hypothetical protein HHL09_10740 [Luteolibacter luteus]